MEKRRELKEFHRTWTDKLGESPEGPTGKILRNVFPKFESAFRNVSHDNEQEWRRQLRACSPDKLPVYFGLAVPLGEITRGELDRLAALAGDPAQFGKALLKLANETRPDGKTRVCQALEQLCDSDVAIIPQDNVPNAIKSLLDVGDELIAVKDETGLWVDVDNGFRITRLLLLLLRRLDQSQRLGALKDSFETGRALSAMVDVTWALGSQYGKYSGQAAPETERLLAKEDLAALEGLAADKIVDAAQTGRILSTPEFRHVLDGWKNWKAGKSLSNWLNEFLAEDSNMLFFLANLIPDNAISYRKDPVLSLKERGYLKPVQGFINVDEHAAHVESLSRRDDLTQQDRIRLKLFLLGRGQKDGP